MQQASSALPQQPVSISCLCRIVRRSFTTIQNVNIVSGNVRTIQSTSFHTKQPLNIARKDPFDSGSKEDCCCPGDDGSVRTKVERVVKIISSTNKQAKNISIRCLDRTPCTSDPRFDWHGGWCKLCHGRSIRARICDSKSLGQQHAVQKEECKKPYRKQERRPVFHSPVGLCLCAAGWVLVLSSGRSKGVQLCSDPPACGLKNSASGDVFS
jgi:hypothetical protein